jgi:hypothetical protein
MRSTARYSSRLPQRNELSTSSRMRVDTSRNFASKEAEHERRIDI